MLSNTRHRLFGLIIILLLLLMKKPGCLATTGTNILRGTTRMEAFRFCSRFYAYVRMQRIW
jgi:hypothetical protein